MSVSGARSRPPVSGSGFLAAVRQFVWSPPSLRWGVTERCAESTVDPTPAHLGMVNNLDQRTALRNGSGFQEEGSQE
jgi:hypothetical protein